MNKEYLNTTKIDKKNMEILHQILMPQRSLRCSQLYYRTRAYELLTHNLERLGRSQENVSGHNKERVRQAAEILIHSMEDPPSLTALSRALSTSHTTLNQEFRESFGTTAFGYLRQVRLDRARDLLEAGDANVTEASLTVGYKSISTFCRAFSDQHGMTPSACLRHEHSA